MLHVSSVIARAFVRLREVQAAGGILSAADEISPVSSPAESAADEPITLSSGLRLVARQSRDVDVLDLVEVTL